MAHNALRFLALLLTALAMAPALAHVLQMPHKMDLLAVDYLTVQKLYAGWALLGIVVIGALLATLVLAVAVRREPRRFRLTLIAAACIAAALAVFFAFTYPVNQQTVNWTQVPDRWEQLRSRWEYSHAAGAVLYLAAFCALVLSVLPQQEERQPAQ